jgi:2EXR family
VVGDDSISTRVGTLGKSESEEELPGSNPMQGFTGRSNYRGKRVSYGVSFGEFGKNEQYGTDNLVESRSRDEDIVVAEDERYTSRTSILWEQAPSSKEGSQTGWKDWMGTIGFDWDISILENGSSGFDYKTTVFADEGYSSQTYLEGISAPSPPPYLYDRQTNECPDESFALRQWIYGQSGLHMDCHDSSKASEVVDTTFQFASRIEEMSPGSSTISQSNTDEDLYQSLVTSLSSEEEYRDEQKLQEGRKITATHEDELLLEQYTFLELNAISSDVILYHAEPKIEERSVEYLLSSHSILNPLNILQFQCHHPRILSQPTPPRSRSSSITSRDDIEEWIGSILSEDGIADRASSSQHGDLEVHPPSLSTSRKREPSRSLQTQQLSKRWKLDHPGDSSHPQFQHLSQPTIVSQSFSPPISDDGGSELEQDFSNPPLYSKRIQDLGIPSPPPEQEIECCPEDVVYWSKPQSPVQHQLESTARGQSYRSGIRQHVHRPRNGSYSTVSSVKDFKSPIAEQGSDGALSHFFYDPVCDQYIEKELLKTRDQNCPFSSPQAIGQSSGGISSQFFYDPVRDLYIEKEILEGQHRNSPESSQKFVEGFPKFPKLPSEIRMRIFEYAILGSGSNNILVSCRNRGDGFPKSPTPLTVDDDGSIPQRNIPHDCPWELRVRYKMPPLLQTNYESRVVAQRIYKLSFGYQLNHERGVWFDFDRDKLIMQSGGAFDFFKHGFKDTDEDRSEAKKVEKALRYLGIRAMVPAEVVALLDYSQDFQTLSDLYLEKGLFIGADVASYEEYFFQRVQGELKGRWSQGQTARVPKIYTLYRRELNKKLGIVESENFEENTPTAHDIKMERRNLKLNHLAWLQNHFAATAI